MTALDLSPFPQRLGAPPGLPATRGVQAPRCWAGFWPVDQRRKGSFVPVGGWVGLSGALAVNLRTDEWPHLSRSWKIKAPPCSLSLGVACHCGWILKYGFTFIDLLTAPNLHCSMWILVPQPRIEPWPLALGAHSLNHQSNSMVGTFKSSLSVGFSRWH